MVRVELDERKKETKPDRSPSPERLPSKDLTPLSLSLPTAGLDVKEGRKGPKGY